tara:strand:+ start:337 stop:465 length:129 start_codon:yes stop_codon:yes gene_type:complete
MFIGRNLHRAEGATAPETLRKKDLEYNNLKERISHLRSKTLK